MNEGFCTAALDGVGSSVAASLHAVDCAANATAQAAFGHLFGHGGALLPALTILLTLYVAFFAFSLLTGRSGLGISALTPRVLTLGLVLTFATSWVAYQGAVWNLAVGAPDEIAGALMGTKDSSTQIFADKIDIVFGALGNMNNHPMPAAQSAFSPDGLMWMGATLLLLGTVGLLATCKIALAVLLALGPVFVVLALFQGTRGLFTGWLKGVVLLAIAPLFAVLGGSLMLELAVPVINTLTQSGEKIEPQPAMAFFLIGAVHVALMIMVLKVAGTMVSGWTVFGLAGKAGSGSASPAAAAAAALRAPAAAQATAAVVSAAAARSGLSSSRENRLAVPPPAANDPGGPFAPRRDARIVAGALSPAAAQPVPLSRARGIGSRFRAAPPRSMEKVK